MTSGASGNASRIPTSTPACGACSSCSCTSCGRSPSWSPARPRGCARYPPTWRPAAPTCGRSWCRSILLDRAINQARAGANYTAGPAAGAGGGGAPGDPGRGGRRGRRCLRGLRRLPGGDCARRRTATGPSARSATTPCCATPRCSPSTPARLRERGRREIDQPRPPRCAPSPSEIAGTDDWHALRARAEPGPSATDGGDAPRLRGLDRARPRTSCSTRGWSRFPAGEECARRAVAAVFQRPVLAVASYVAPPAFSDSMRGPLLRALRARRRREDGDRQAAGVEQPTRASPRTAVHEAYPGPPLAPGHGQAATRRRCGRCSARPTSPRAGRSTPSG